MSAASAQIVSAMPYVKRKKRIRDAVSGVVTASLLFTVPSLVLWPFAVGFGNCCNWLSGASMKSVVPTVEELIPFLLLGVFIAIVATPLALRDHFSNGRYEIAFEPSNEVMDQARIYAKMLLNQQFGAIYKSFSDELQSNESVDEFLSELNFGLKPFGVPAKIESVQEVEGGYASEMAEDIDSVIDSQPDPHVTVHFSHGRKGESVLTLQLERNPKFRISHFCYFQQYDESDEC